MQPGSRPYAWPFFYRIRGVHAGQGSPVGGHLLLLAPFGHGGGGGALGVMLLLWGRIRPFRQTSAW